MSESRSYNTGGPNKRERYRPRRFRPDPEEEAPGPTVQLLTRRPETPTQPDASTPPPSGPPAKTATPQPQWPIQRNIVRQAAAAASQQTQSRESSRAPEPQVIEPHVARDAVRFLSDFGEMLDHFNELASDSNTSYRVIGAIGPQSTGKSTLLSMLAGNQELDMYRQYAFRPSAREALESSRYQTTKMTIFVNKSRHIFVDCQAMNCVTYLEDLISHTRHGKAHDVSTGMAESVQLVSWMLQVCHTVAVCIDWFLDIDLIRQIRTAELLRANIVKVATNNSLPDLNVSRKTNLIFVHTRAKSVDFTPGARQSRARLIRNLFKDSFRLSISDDYVRREGEEFKEPTRLVYYPLAEIKSRQELNESTTRREDHRKVSWCFLFLHLNVSPRELLSLKRVFITKSSMWDVYRQQQQQHSSV